jgi:hypothetical protein|tara:strand:+ start:110 stop:358 length:249 start_codon:yes stop_codon:yes gene_type:complete
MNIGDVVEYYNLYNEKKSGVVTEIFSDMDSYDEVKLENGIPMYYSKKLSRFVPVKEKNMASIFFTVENVRCVKEFISYNEIL